jgi:hypothetical protein
MKIVFTATWSVGLWKKFGQLGKLLRLPGGYDSQKI